MKIVIASEHAGYHMKVSIVRYLKESGYEIDDLGVQSTESVNYPFIAANLAEYIIKGVYEKGILICGTGLGMSIAAGKVPGIRAALCTDQFMAKMAREHNDANVLCLGAWITGIRLSQFIVNEFIKSEFTGGRHRTRLNLIDELERRYGSTL
jgi:ribose 5-phosphate isomerase B